MATKYNPYNAVKKISELKGNWHTAKQQGKDPSGYASEAVGYYNELRNNGEGGLADELAGVDYTGSLDILARYKAPQAYDDWYDNIVGEKIKEASKPVRSDTVNQILSAYEQNNNMLNGAITRDENGNVVTGLNQDHYNVGRNQLDYINNYDVTSQPWYDSLMSQYQLGGQNAAQGALASGASGNSGNIDSYAAANANRQQLAFTNAGTQAALDTVAQNMAAWQNLYESMGGRLDTMGTQANEVLRIGSDYYAADSAERQNALNTAAALEAQKYQNQIDELLAGISADTAKYQVDRDYDASKLASELGLEGTKYQSDNSLKGTYAQAEANKYGANKDYEAAVYANDVQKQIADAELAAQFAASNGQITFDMIKDLLEDEYKRFEDGTSPYKNLNELYNDYVKDFGEFSDEIYEYLKDAKTRQKWLSEN